MTPQQRVAFGEAVASRARQLAEKGRNTQAEVWMMVAQCHWAVAANRFYGPAGMFGESWRGEFRRPDGNGWMEIGPGYF